MTEDAVLIDVGTGNLRSVHHALISLEFTIKVTEDPDDVARASKIILPGVGAFAKFMEGARTLGLEDILKTAVFKGIPLLGICVGMQALFDLSEEMGSHSGLSIVHGNVIKFSNGCNLKIPHTGWNQLWPQKNSPLLKGLDEGCYAYFNHSYYCNPQNEEDTAATTDYGGSFSSVIQRDNLFGVQFHPEKSQRVGLRILENFIKL